MKAKTSLMGMICLIKKALNKPKVLISAIVFIYLCTQCIATKAQKPERKTVTITGIVVSAKNGKPVEGVAISASAGTVQQVLTDQNGKFSISTTSIKGGKLLTKLDGYDNQLVQFTPSLTKFKIMLQPINDPFSDKNPNFEALKIGEKVPDIEFAIKNYHSSTAKISDFKGKLVIFDFWTTSCSSCINSFPEMENLQKLYGDKIQVILVNVNENEEQIKSRLAYRRNPISQLSTIPSIVSNLALKQLFPKRYAGNYIWIDSDGNFILSSSQHINNHGAKINDAFAGKKITFVETGVTYKSGEKPLYQLMNNPLKKYPELGSLFTSVNYNYFSTGGQIEGEIDTISNTLRNTHINKSIILLYNLALKESLKEEWKSKVYGPNRGSYNYYDHFSILVKDSTLYDKKFIPYYDQTDINVIKSQFCYEQILPSNTNIEQASNYMKEDLDRFFGLKYGTKVIIEEVSIPCFLLKRINKKTVTKKEVRTQLKHLGKREYKSIGDFDSIIDQFYRPVGDELPTDSPYIFDVDGLNKERETIMPVWKTGDKLEDFILALNANGLDLIKSERKMKMIVVRDNQ